MQTAPALHCPSVQESGTATIRGLGTEKLPPGADLQAFMRRRLETGRNQEGDSGSTTYLGGQTAALEVWVKFILNRPGEDGCS